LVKNCSESIKLAVTSKLFQEIIAWGVFTYFVHVPPKKPRFCGCFHFLHLFQRPALPRLSPLKPKGPNHTSAQSGGAENGARAHDREVSWSLHKKCGRMSPGRLPAELHIPEPQILSFTPSQCVLSIPFPLLCVSVPTSPPVRSVWSVRFPTPFPLRPQKLLRFFFE